MAKRRLILQSHYSLGDIVLMTAAVRDLHRCYPRQFITDVRTSWPELWENNPYLKRLGESDPRVQTLSLDYPLIHFCNHVPYHAIHGYIDSLNETLGIDSHGTEFKGDIHLTAAEKSAPSPVAEAIGREIPFWIIAAGGKPDITIKWWDLDRYQEVVDQFRGRIQFVQVGAAGDFHPKLKGAIDLRGRTSTRQLVRLVYHAQGVLCGVTGLMHLAAAVESKEGRGGLRPCVVIAGGREPSHWEAYPHHQFIHNVGALACCATGGCWKTRTVPSGDGDRNDHSSQLCLDPVGLLPRCMDMIPSAEVVRRIESYFTGGAVRYLARAENVVGTKGAGTTHVNSFDHQPLHPGIARAALEQAKRHLPEYPGGHLGRGIVICAGGVKYFTNAWVCINMLRHHGCRIPVQLWHLGPEEFDSRMAALVAPLGVTCVDAFKVRPKHPCRILQGWELKPYALLHSPFRETLLIDADNVPLTDPTPLFDTPGYRRTGALFWPDLAASRMSPRGWHLCGLTGRDEWPFETGQVLLDKARCWPALRLTMWFNEHSDFWYQHTLGDKETFHLAWRKLDAPFSMPEFSPRQIVGALIQHDFHGHPLFQHRNGAKWNLSDDNPTLPGFQFEDECFAFLEELRARWDQCIRQAPPKGSSLKPRSEPRNGRANAGRIERWDLPRKRLDLQPRLR
jgi:ADP-heptose:LPS heptosyltransferase